MADERPATVDLRGIRCLLIVENGTVFDRQVMLGRGSRIVPLRKDVVAAALRAAKDAGLEVILMSALREQGWAAPAEPIIPVLAHKEG